MAVQDEFSIVLATVGLADLEESAVRLSMTLDADGARAQASVVRQAYLKLLGELKTIAVKVSKQAEEAVKQHEAASRVRPDSGGAGGPRLGDFIGTSRPIPGVEGSVGINHEPTLEAGGVDWWWTNEEGYSGHIGRQVYGFFQPGRSRPDPNLSGTHPVFEPSRQGGKMTIGAPIPERKFVREGAAVAETSWHASVHRAKREFIASCERAVLAAPPPRPRGARRGAPRRRLP